MPTMIVYGPPCSGKTLSAAAMAKHFGCTEVVDEWTKDDRVTVGALHLTRDECKRGMIVADRDTGRLIGDITVMSIHEAKAEICAARDALAFLPEPTNLTLLKPRVAFKLTSPDVPLPSYETEGAAGADIRAWFPEARRDDPLYVPSGGTAMIGTGLFPEIEPGYEIQVRPRSGLAAKHNVTVLNSPGTVDSDYRGEIKVLLRNHGRHAFPVHHGDRIAQIVVAPVQQAEFVVVHDLGRTDRGTGGFGSTGV